MSCRSVFVALLCVFLFSCRSTQWLSVSDNRNHGVLLADVAAEDGTRRVWRVYSGNDRDPRIDCTESNVKVAPNVGLSVSTVTR
jgi:hypothetical protein